jgi:CubicO group peptidase (beta-lactamase class C family)
MRFSIFKASLPLFLISETLADLTCRPDGPVVPRPRNLEETRAFQDGVASFTNALEDAISGKIKAGWAVENLTFSLAVVSADQADPASPIWEYHHLAERAANGTKIVTRDSQYLIGSISKVISDLLLQKSGLDIDLPVTDWIPKLGENSSKISWDEVSLRALASHLSGAPTNCTLSSLAAFELVSTI